MSKTEPIILNGKAKFMTDHLVVVVNSAVEAEEAPPFLCVARLATNSAT